MTNEFSQTPQNNSSSGPPLSTESLEQYVSSGVFTKIENHKEHIALHPFWISNTKAGVVEELDKGLGKWKQSVEGYMVAYDSVKSCSKVAALGEDHIWLHIDVYITCYLYTPSVGQKLSGIIRKVGNRAAVCDLFNVFIATVFASDENELASWSKGMVINFEIYSFVNRRKGPIIRANSIPPDSQDFNTVVESVTEHQTEFIEVDEEMAEVEESSPKKAKKHKKSKKLKKSKKSLENEDISMIAD